LCHLGAGFIPFFDLFGDGSSIAQSASLLRESILPSFNKAFSFMSYSFGVASID